MPDQTTARIHPASFGLEAQQAELADRMMRRTPLEGVNDPGIPGFSMMRISEPSQPLSTVYEPSICVVVQGSKQAMLGAERYVYDPLNYLVVSMSLPVVGNVIEANRRQALSLPAPRYRRQSGQRTAAPDPGAAASAAPRNGGRALFLASTSAQLLDAVLRLVRLLDTPEEAAVLAPLALREIHYRVLTGELGQQLCELCAADGQAQRNASTIALLKSRYAEPLRIEELADAAHLSVSALHHRFKAVTAMSPLQYQKQLRLQEARRLDVVGWLRSGGCRASRRLRKPLAVQPRISPAVRCAATCGTQAQPIFRQAGS